MAAAAVVEGEVAAVAIAAEDPDGAGGGNSCGNQLATENQVYRWGDSFEIMACCVGGVGGIVCYSSFARGAKTLSSP